MGGEGLARSHASREGGGSVTVSSVVTPDLYQGSSHEEGESWVWLVFTHVYSRERRCA